MSQSRSSFLPTLLVRISLVLALAGASFPSLAQRDEDDDIRQSVARIAYLSGSASYSRGDDPDNWQEAPFNLPLTRGDRLYTGQDGRLELQVPGTRIYLAPQTQLTALDMRDDTLQLSVSVGTASFRVHRLPDDQVFEVDTPNVSITFRDRGSYRIDVDQDGNTRVAVFEGSALAVAAGGQIDLNRGDAIHVDGIDQPSYDFLPLPRWDSWDVWVDARARPRRPPVSIQYANSDIVGIDDLDENGRWERIPDYGWAWSPMLAASWAPYRDGRWMWQDPWGWTWVSYERWGWAPYHYGSWISSRGRWYWVPVGRSDPFPSYAPARVVFTGGGPGGPAVDYVGWFPIGPRDHFVRWWGRPAVDVREYTHVTYVNQTFVTVVRRDTFIGGVYVRDRFINDSRVIHQVSAGPVFRGTLPFVPTLSSIRFAPGPRSIPIPRPPATFLARSVVTRIAPPIAPPVFSAKVDFIRENRGRPVDRAVSEKLSVEHNRGARAIVDVRPAVPEAGRVQFTPKREADVGHRVQPATAPTGRVLATRERPVERPAAKQPEQRQPERPAFRQPEQRQPERPEPKQPEQRQPERPAFRQPEQRQPERPETKQPEQRQPERPAFRQPEQRQPERPETKQPEQRQPERPAFRQPEQRQPERPEPKQPEQRPPQRQEVKQPEQRQPERPAFRQPEQRQPERQEVKQPERPPERPAARQPEQRQQPPAQQAPPRGEQKPKPTPKPN